MSDYFSLLGQTRQPWLDPEALKAMFLQLSAPMHPDRFHGASDAELREAQQRFTEFNTAYNCLRDPKERLAHLLELELGTKLKNVQRIPPGTADLFMEVAQICRDVDAFLAEKAKVTSPLLKVPIFERGLEWTDRLQQLQQKVGSQRELFLNELKDLNDQWAPVPASAPNRQQMLPLERLEQIYRSLSYFSRWFEQIQERLVQLSF